MSSVLVVDDESDARAFVSAVLEAEGWDVTEAEDGEKGLELIRKLKPDLVVLDVQMPNMNGFDVFRRLAEDAEIRDTKVIMLTGVAEKTGLGFSAEDMEQFLGRKPAAYIEKPINPASLRRVVARVTAGD